VKAHLNKKTDFFVTGFCGLWS